MTMMNKALASAATGASDDYCAGVSPRGYMCTREGGHDRDHVATLMDGSVVDVWGQEPPRSTRHNHLS